MRIARMMKLSTSIYAEPAALLISQAAGLAAKWQDSLQGAGWRLRHADSLDKAIELLGPEPYALILVDARLAANHVGAAALLRAVPGPNASAPILRLGEDHDRQADPKSSEFDGVVPVPENGADAAALLELWRPISLDATRRIAQILGAGPIDGMIERLARRLEAARSLLDKGVVDRAEAHRLAGLCGTLGFARAHAAWLDLSRGDDSVLDEVRRISRLTRAAIARGI